MYTLYYLNNMTKLLRKYFFRLISMLMHNTTNTDSILVKINIHTVT